MVGVIAVAFLVLVVLIACLALALVLVTKQGKVHSRLNLFAKLNGCGEVRVEVTPPEPTREAQ